MFKKKIPILTCAGYIHIYSKDFEKGIFGGFLVGLLDGTEIAYDPHASTRCWDFREK